MGFKKFPNRSKDDRLSLLVSGYPEDKEDALFIHQDARIYGGKVSKSAKFDHQITHQIYVLASSGRFNIITDDAVITLNKGDGAEITKVDSILFDVIEDSEILVIDAPRR
ncbi:hypothetical protein O1D97_17525 [Marinomonas sp. 15G1-11]|uniref:Quercetin 2,3-dioxygenase C-terminal cupin domain-containing protein n=1 Tax=Marinomonas phaeophyticola TaxID=3004091 RepID=A0ABT4JYK3_9GAMM|nr:hypothetical protein [Marinomonas sp. 15G1-11]MCZ2723358.1 hypothetical protein [Marinomonas sp. 15G1-11]